MILSTQVKCTIQLIHSVYDTCNNLCTLLRNHNDYGIEKGLTLSRSIYLWSKETFIKLGMIVDFWSSFLRSSKPRTKMRTMNCHQ